MSKEKVKQYVFLTILMSVINFCVAGVLIGTTVINLKGAEAAEENIQQLNQQIAVIDQETEKQTEKQTEILVKETSKAAIAALKSVGVARTVMLTGDAKEVADAVAKELGIDQVRSELLPADKVQNVEELLMENKGNGNLAFVGDGINDAPVLTRADIGIAMGAMGSDAAIEAADVVLMDDDPMKISQAIRISRKCLAIVNQNTWFSIGIKLVVLLLGAVGIANMWFAIFADVGVMILAVLNAMRALFAGRTA